MTILHISVPVLAAGVIRIGVIGPMNFVQGQGHWNEATMAAEEINAMGGIRVGAKKMKVELVKADSNEHLSITDATNAMERLMTREKVDFVVGAVKDLIVDIEGLKRKFYEEGMGFDYQTGEILEDKIKELGLEDILS